MQRSPILLSSAISPSDRADPWPGPDQLVAAEESSRFSDPAPLEILRRDAAEGRVDLDSLLAKVAESARSLTGASGAALALWSQGVFICRARSGEPAPELGAKLDPESGLSGECLLRAETVRCDDTDADPRVDIEVCAELGLRSLLAVPLRGRNGVIGLLEVFSTVPYAFATTEIDLLQQLGEIAVIAREGSAEGLTVEPPASQASGVAESQQESPPTGEHVHRSQGLVAWVLREEGQKTRLAVLGLVVAAILTWLGWMLSRQDGTAGSRKAGHHVAVAALPTSSRATPAGAGTEIELSVPAPATQPHPRERTKEDTAAGDVVHRAAQFKSLPGPAPQAYSATPDGVAGAAAQSHHEDVAPLPASEVSPGNNAKAAESPGGIVVTQMDLPTNGSSPAVTPGVLLHKVMPSYPPEAAGRHGNETVVLDFVVGEDGQVRDLKVRSGTPPFADAAQTAVQQWRYSPCLLNGQPVAMPATVSIVFSQQ
jgi:TonB family protein